jgi:hypothetical protein
MMDEWVGLSEDETSGGHFHPTGHVHPSHGEVPPPIHLGEPGVCRLVPRPTSSSPLALVPRRCSLTLALPRLVTPRHHLASPRRHLRNLGVNDALIITALASRWPDSRRIPPICPCLCPHEHTKRCWARFRSVLQSATAGRWRDEDANTWQLGSARAHPTAKGSSTARSQISHARCRFAQARSSSRREEGRREAPATASCVLCAVLAIVARLQPVATSVSAGRIRLYATTFPCL